jgi:hypothetical protein
MSSEDIEGEAAAGAEEVNSRQLKVESGGRRER